MLTATCGAERKSWTEWYPPPCISYANVRNYYGPYAHCSLDKGVACAKHIQLPTQTCARMVWVHLDLCPHFQVYPNTRQPWEHENFRFTPMLAQAMKNAKPTNVRLGNPSCDHTPCGTIAHAHHLKMPLAEASVHHRDSHPNLAWRPIPQPRQTGSPEGGPLKGR